MKEQKVTLELAVEHGLTKVEFENIKVILGRVPNFTELGIFSVMWSEHCSYKSSIAELKKLPREALARIRNLKPEDNPYGNLHEYYIAKNAMPTPMLRDCTGKFKINPIRNSLRDRYAEGTYFDMHVCINYTEAGERMIIRKDLEGLKSFLTYKDTNSPIAKAVQKQMKKHNITVEQYLEKLSK